MQLRVSISQDASTHHATGLFQLAQDGRTMLRLTSLGDLQIDTGWASFTGVARLANQAEEPVVVILDQNDAMRPGNTFVSVEGVNISYSANYPAELLRIER